MYTSENFPNLKPPLDPPLVVVNTILELWTGMHHCEVMFKMGATRL